MSEEKKFPDYFEFDGPAHRHSWRRTGDEDGEVFGKLTNMVTGEKSSTYPLSSVRRFFDGGGWYFAEGFDYVKPELEFPDKFQFWNEDEGVVYNAGKLLFDKYLITWDHNSGVTLTEQALRSFFDTGLWEFYEPKKSTLPDEFVISASLGDSFTYKVKMDGDKATVTSRDYDGHVFQYTTAFVEQKVESGEWTLIEPNKDEPVDSIRIVKTCFVTIDGVTYKAEGDDVAKLTDLHTKYQQLKDVRKALERFKV